jgi:hypothetical protein
MQTDNSSIARELLDLEDGRLDPKQFPHSEHVRLGFEMLRCYSFPEALVRFSKGLRKLAIKGGRPEAYHETITAAFLALIGERFFGGEYVNWEEFAARNCDLLSKNLLREWYEPEVLSSAIARRTFVLPKPRVAVFGEPSSL